MRSGPLACEKRARKGKGCGDQKRDLPMTKGCLAAGGEASSTAAAAAVPLALTAPLEWVAAAGEALAEEGEDGEDGEERRSASRRRPLKWAPTAASMTSSTAFSGIALPAPPADRDSGLIRGFGVPVCLWGLCFLW